MSRQPKLLFIAGHPRSGTTLLTRLCNSHPDMVVTNEFRNFRYLNSPIVTHVRGLRKNIWKWALLSFAQESRFQKGIKNGLFLTRYLMNVLPYWRQPVDAEVVRATLHKVLPNTPIVGDKFPDYFRKLPELTQIEDSCMVVIYRACPDVVQSTLRQAQTEWKHMPWARQMDSADKVAQRWVRAIALMERYREKIHIIRYEELVTDPEPVLALFGAYLQVDPAGFDRTLVKVTSIGKHRNFLTEEQLVVIESIAGETMKRLGYG